MPLMLSRNPDICLASERYYVHSSKFNSLLEDHLRLPITVLTRIQDERNWQTAISFYVRVAFVPFGSTRMVVETLMSNLFLFTPPRKKLFTIALLQEISRLRKEDKRYFGQ